MKLLAAVAKFVVPMVIGVVLTLLLVPLWIRWTDTHWVSVFEAVGTWVGGLATVGALVWAVRVFRSERRLSEREQAEKERAKAEEQEEQKRVERAAADAAASSAIERASLVSIRVVSGGAHGHSGSQVLTSVVIKIENDTDAPVTVTAIALDAPYVMSPLTEAIRVGPHEATSRTRMIEEAHVADGDSAGRLEIGAVAKYRLNGLDWSRHTMRNTIPLRDDSKSNHDEGDFLS